MKQAATENLVNDKEESEPTEGFLNVGNGDESEKPQSELKELDCEKEEGSVEEDDKGSEKDGEESMDQMETTEFMRYFYENDDGKRIGSGFEHKTPSRGSTGTPSQILFYYFKKVTNLGGKCTLSPPGQAGR